MLTLIQNTHIYGFQMRTDKYFSTWLKYYFGASQQVVFFLCQSWTWCLLSGAHVLFLILHKFWFSFICFEAQAKSHV